MIGARRARRPAAVAVLVLAAVAALWYVTAGQDAEHALWRRYSAGSAALNVAVTAALLAAGYVFSAPAGVAARLGRTMLVMFGAGITLAALELPTLAGHDYGRTFGTRSNDTWLQLSTSVNRRDETLIHVHQPHTRYRGAVVGNLVRLGIPSPAPYHVDVAYDHNGFRNDVDYTSADVVAIGDSFVEGAEVPLPQTAAAQLAERLGRPVANLGQSNYGPQQELAVLERYGVPLAPKAVVWFLFGGNNLADIERYEWERAHLDQLLAPPPLSERSFSRNALRAVARVTTPVRRVASPTARHHAATFVNASGAPEVIYLDAEEEPWEPRQWEATSQVLGRAHEITRRIGAELLVVYIPRKLRVYQGFLQAEPGTAAHTWQMNDLPDVVADWCRAHGVSFLDSTVPLRRAVAAGTSVYLPDDVHWSPAGHAVVAGAVAEQLRQGSALPGAATEAAR